MRLKQALADFFKLIGGRGLASLLQLAILAVLARSTSVDQFGVFALALTWGAFAGLAIDLGLNQLVVREIGSGTHAPAAVFTGGLKLRALMAIPVLVFAAGVARLAYDQSMLLPVILGCLVLMLRIVSEYCSAVLVSFRRAWPAAAGMIAPNLLALILISFLAVFRINSVSLFLCAYFIAAALAASSMCALTVRSATADAAHHDALPLLGLLRQAVPYAMFPLGSLLYFPGDAILISFFAAPAEVGLYQAAERLILALDSIGLALLMLTLPRFSQAYYHSEDELERIAAPYRKLVLLGVLPGALAIGTLAPTIIRVAYGPSYHQAASVLPVLAVVAAARTFNALLTSELVARGRQGWLSMIVWIVSPLQALAAWLLLPHMQWTAMAWIVVGTNLVITGALALSLFRGRVGHSGYALRWTVAAAAGVSAAWGTWSLGQLAALVAGLAVYGIAGLLLHILPEGLAPSRLARVAGVAQAGPQAEKS
ncbi:MAG: oligosaccharide flippase family protein [Terriglobales bacterium]